MRFAKAAALELKRETSGAITEIGPFGEKVIKEVPIKFYASKNKLSEPYKTSFSFLNLDKNKKMAFNFVSDVFAFGQEYGVIDVRGAWVFFRDLQGNEIHKCNGAAKAIEFLSTDMDLYSKIKFLIYSKMYRPFEFYYLYDKLSRMINIENQKFKEYYGFEKTPFDINTIFRLSDVMTEDKIKEAKEELERLNQGKEIHEAPRFILTEDAEE